jgi:hypothetical protein
MRVAWAWVTRAGLMAAVLSGCASRGPATDDGSARHNAEIALEVENHGWSDVVIYLVRGNASERLGMVGSLSSETFVFPFRRLGIGGDVRLRADPIGGPTGFTSENLYVQPGQWIKWTLESDLSRSFLGVY